MVCPKPGLHYNASPWNVLPRNQGEAFHVSFTYMYSLIIHFIKQSMICGLYDK